MLIVLLKRFLVLECCRSWLHYDAKDGANYFVPIVTFSMFQRTYDALTLLLT